MSTLPRPGADEYNEYYGKYVALVPDGDIVLTLREQLADTLDLLARIEPEGETFRYDDDKWSVREVVGHLIDTERLFAFRALAMARQEGTDLPGMDQDVWAASSNADQRELADLTKEWISVRRSNVHMFATFDEATGARTGRASGFDFTVRSFAWIMAGHELWHRRLIEEHYIGDGSQA